MWEKQLEWLQAVSFWDWFWHLVAALLCVYFSVPQLSWPMISKVIKWYKKKRGISVNTNTKES